ncbi:TetR/AcrR family transcriptional regulator C-terminal domain-containing protein [Nocardia amamiensis]|uniref:TetR/AcrR family transcriptional regulator C-terminal domain-containing protein n=1 Tax=Nocardia amamiensis TaxID=404578 RepID=A0ABS0CY49_9NOCA|nr:TetR/AcrR family transcriptional regulator C-terminal domain-containing protein [Nocardia amamiensis]MBF6301286.1 TetR/AcrR family transcriptional regulator C-terminal domain-containing protein [Nocardia amamiensis]
MSPVHGLQDAARPVRPRLLRRELDLDADTAMHAAITLFGYVRGCATDLEHDRIATDETGIDAETELVESDSQLAAILANGRYPHFAALRAAPGVIIDPESLFYFGLNRLLDGITIAAAVAP